MYIVRVSLSRNQAAIESICSAGTFIYLESSLLSIPLHLSCKKSNFRSQKESAIEISHIYDEVLPWQVANTLVASTCSPEYILVNTDLK